MSEPIATWNPARGAWETPVLNLLCGHLEPFSQTWPKSGSMRSGSVFPRPVPGPAISAGGCSSSRGLLPTPNATDSQGGPRAVPETRTSGGPDFGPRLRDVAPTLLPTPTSNVSGRTGEQHMAMREAIGRTTPSQLEAAVQLLPTPRASANENRQTRRTPSQEAGEHGLCLAAEVMDLLPTPRVSGGSGIMSPPPSTLTGRHGLDLGPAIGSLLPTPSATDSHGHYNRSRDRSGEMLLPGVVRELSGATRQQSDATSAS